MINSKAQDTNYALWHEQPAYWYDYVKLLSPIKEATLDIGCGNAWLAQHITNYTGVDSSSAAITTAKKRGANAILTSAEDKLPFPDNNFTCVLLKDVLEHLHNPVFTVNEAIRVLKTGGKIVAFAPDAQRWVWDDYTHIRPYSKKSFFQLFTDCGAKIEKVSYEPIMPGIGKLCQLLRLRARPLPFWWLAKLPFMRRNVYIIAKKL